jgi:peroxiredoxin
MTPRQEKAAKIGLLGFVMLFVVFFSRPQGRTPALGEAVPDFTLRNDDGGTVSLADFRGKVVVLNFWATWCGPCIEEMPSLKQFAEKYADQGVQVIGVSEDTDADAYREFIAKHEINFLTLRNPARTVSAQYGTFRLPETYIISRDGKLLNKIIGPTDWSSPQMYSYFDSLIAGS